MESPVLSRLGHTDFNPKHAVSWLETQPEEEQLWQVVFQELLLCAAKPRQSSGNACVKLHGFVEQCSGSTKPVLRDFAFEESTALRLFDFFMEWNEQDSHRSMRLILNFLTYFIYRNPSTEVGISVKEIILNNTISTITQKSSRPAVKSAMMALDHFIQKKLIYPSEALEVYRESHGLSRDENNLWDAFIAKIFTWMELHHISSIAGKLLVTIFTSPYSKDSDLRHQPEVWHEFIYRGLMMNSDYLEPIKLYIFVPLFRADRAGSLVYLQHLSSLQKLTSEDSNSWDLNSMLWLSMLEAGKKVGVVDEPGRKSIKDNEPAFQLRADVLESVLCHESYEARSSAVSILIASPSTTKPYTEEALKLLKKHLPSFHEDSEPKMRYDILGHSRNMIKRIQSTLESLRRENEKTLKKISKAEQNEITNRPTEDARIKNPKKNQAENAKELGVALSQHEDFISWYVSFLQAELAPTTSYQRHITALKAMEFIIKSTIPQNTDAGNVSELKNLLVDATWFRAVLDLIMDPFDDVRETAASLIMSLLRENGNSKLQEQMNGLGGTPIEELQSFCHKADELARRTARADHSDGAARSFELLCCSKMSMKERIQIPFEVLSSLEAKLSAAEQDLATAVLQAPVHGSFASLRYIWGSLSNIQISEADAIALAELQDRAIVCCWRIWKAVRHVLCDDSPEGHLPEELEEVEGLDTKDLLSYSFRAIHESSNLMRTIASNTRHSQSTGLLAPSRQNFETIGRLTFEELSNLRHRGAFTTVSQTFTSCCQLVKYFPGSLDDGSNLLDEWYKGALACIHTQASTTRRSAGIPALIVGILSSNADHPSFENVIHNLQDIGRRPAHVSETDGSNLPQVHALNCIKDIFKSSYLSNKAEPYLTECLQLAANSLKSEIWAIRNCGLLLLRSLIDCLFGTNESKASIEAGWDGRTIKIPYHKFKALPALLVNLLEMGQQSKGVLIGTQTAESVFPALDIIRRAGPPEDVRDKLYDIIAWYLGSPIWHVREIAARTLCAFLLKPNWLEPVTDLLVHSGKSANQLHGALLTLKFLLERLAEVMSDQLSDHTISALYDLLQRLPAINNSVCTCSEANAVYVEISSFVLGLTQTRNAPKADLDVEAWSLLPYRVLEPNYQSRIDIGPSALLNIRLGQAAIQNTLQQPNTESSTNLTGLSRILTAALTNDINVACSILESTSSTHYVQSDEARANLVNAYIQVCLETEAPEPRTIALESLATLLDKALSSTQETGYKYIPAHEIIFKLWVDLHKKPMNPSLSDAIIRVSGAFLAISVSQNEAGHMQTPPMSWWLRSWGMMMSDAGMADRTFDTRLASVQAMHSFSISIAPLNKTTEVVLDSSHLPWLLALYDALNDDDDEIRAAAAGAVAPVLSNQNLVSVEAGPRLLQYLLTHYGAVDEFRAHVTCRMVGHFPLVEQTPGKSSSAKKTIAAQLLGAWVPAEEQLEQAMRFDDALFVVEEQNLYVDEVRETQRWRDVFLSLPSSPSAAAEAEAALSQWTLAGLQTLTRLAQREGVDGPLGWTSKPEVFAIAARILISGAALARVGDKEVERAMRQFRDEGRKGQVHGLLLGMCD
ncbi:hypothetical protein M426DRAFT_100842 [Hypoxylon sp. CI-4A]|nr:hypothetical protein M426DRAFT_100842 [Hypoxylon sp. CI-4A]